MSRKNVCHHFGATTRMASAVALAAVLFSGGEAVAGGAGTATGPVTEAGETIGLALGAALPPGLYFIDTASVVHNRSNTRSGFQSGATLDVMVNIPVVAWSTPWDFLGGHLEAYAALPEATTSTHGRTAGGADLSAAGKGLNGSGLYNPAFFVGEAWNLGNDFHFSNFVGFYAPVNQAGFSYANATNDVWTFNERAALTYNGNGYNVTAHMIYGTSTSTSNPEMTSGSGVSCAVKSCQRADYLNIDFAALKSLGNWEVGPVGYYTTDVSHTSDRLRGNRQIALGGFVGYNLGSVVAQTYVTQDLAVSEGHLLGGTDTRVFFRLVAPIWSPSKP